MSSNFTLYIALPRLRNIYALIRPHQALHLFYILDKQGETYAFRILRNDIFFPTET